MPQPPRRYRRLPRAGLALLAGLACALPYGPASAAAGLPAIGGPGPAEHHPGKIIWADLVTPDLAAAERFYSGLFGWTFKLIHAGTTEYAVAVVDGRPVAGILERPLPAGERRQPAWLPFIAVRDVDAATRIAEGHGGKQLVEPKTYPGRGTQAVLADPDGAAFAVLASSSGDPEDALAAPGEWIWSSLLVPDPAHDADFYHAVFGYELFDLPQDETHNDAAVHVILSTDGYARASLNSLPTQGHRRAHWLNFVRVTDAAAATAKAVSLGGRVLVEPHVDRHGGRIAVVADPAGAPIGLMEWVEGQESTAEPTASTAEPTP